MGYCPGLMGDVGMEQVIAGGGGQGLRSGLRRYGGRNRDVNALAVVELRARLARLPASDGDVAFVDQLARARTRQLRDRARDEDVEPLAALIGAQLVLVTHRSRRTAVAAGPFR